MLSTTFQQQLSFLQKQRCTSMFPLQNSGCGVGQVYVFTARCYSQRGLCCRKMSICLSLRPSHAGILSKRPKKSQNFFQLRLSTPFQFTTDSKKSVKMCLTVSTEYRRVTDGQTDRQTGRHTDGQTDILRPHSLRQTQHRSVKMVQDTWPSNRKQQMYGLYSGAIFSDLE